MFNDRFGKIGLANAASMFAAWTWLSLPHFWLTYLPFVLLIIFAVYLNRLGRSLLDDANTRVDRWSKKMQELEKANGVQGDVRIFSNEDDDIARLGATFNVEALTRLVWVAIIL